MFTENRRLRDELRTTHARIAALEAERNDYLRKDRRAGVLTLDAFREAAAAALRGSQRRGEPAALVLVEWTADRAAPAARVLSSERTDLGRSRAYGACIARHQEAIRFLQARAQM